MQANIVVDVAGSARIMDFGLATVARDSNSLESTVEVQGATARYTAPEILKGVANHSKESDVFAFWMVMVEVRADEFIPLQNDLILCFRRSPARFRSVNFPLPWP